MIAKKSHGDYQTPIDFALKICNFLKTAKNLNPKVIFEPTCGIGNFLKAAQIFNAEKYFGLEINPEYCKICNENISNEKVTIANKNFFECNKNFFPKSEKLLVIGNPPWVNNAELSKLNSNNLPQKNNFKNLCGLNALTGESNFDICEYIIENLIEIYRGTNTIFAVLCKTSVAKNIFEEIIRRNIFFKEYEIFKFDAKKIWGINASTCLLYIELAEENIILNTGKIYDFNEPNKVEKIFGCRDGKFYNDLSNFAYDFDGQCCFEWRQGIKHDLSKIMELTFENGNFKNGFGEIVELEKDFIFQLAKGSTIKNPIINNFSKYVIVTQKFLGEDTAHLKFVAPKTWNYLKKNSALFAKRKSKIYNNTPEFSMFGIGEYSFLPYKICIGGMNKKPFFSLIFSNDKNKPVMLDDTSYFIGFKNYDAAYTAMIFLNTDKVRNFLQNLIFVDAKRPFTKKILSRIDFSKIYSAITTEEVFETEKILGLKKYLNLKILNDFSNILAEKEIELF